MLFGHYAAAPSSNCLHVTHKNQETQTRIDEAEITSCCLMKTMWRTSWKHFELYSCRNLRKMGWGLVGGALTHLVHFKSPDQPEHKSKTRRAWERAAVGWCLFGSSAI